MGTVVRLAPVTPTLTNGGTARQSKLRRAPAVAFIDVDPVAAALVQACFIPGEVGIVQCRCSHKLDDLLNKEEEHRASRH